MSVGHKDLVFGTQPRTGTAENERHSICTYWAESYDPAKRGEHKALPGVEPGFPSQGGGIGLVPATFLPGRGL